MIITDNRSTTLFHTPSKHPVNTKVQYSSHSQTSHDQNIDRLPYVVLLSSLFTSEAGEAPYITSSGFQFLLLDTASQLWYFTLQYLKTAQVPVSFSILPLKAAVFKLLVIQICNKKSWDRFLFNFMNVLQTDLHGR